MNSVHRHDGHDARNNSVYPHELGKFDQIRGAVEMQDIPMGHDQT